MVEQTIRNRQVASSTLALGSTPNFPPQFIRHTAFVAHEDIVRKHYSKWIPERQTAFDNAIRATWKW